jgi:hypothetical protein
MMGGGGGGKRRTNQRPNSIWIIRILLQVYLSFQSAYLFHDVADYFFSARDGEL